MRIANIAALTAAVAVLLPCAPAAAQGGVEVGIYGTALDLGSFYDTRQAGAGARLGFRLTERLVLEGDFAALPGDADLTLRGGRKLLAFAGPRFALVRGGGVELFLRVRAGVVRFGEGRRELELVCIAIFPPPGECSIADTRAALDLGGGLMLFADRRMGLRFDVGDTLTRFNDDSYDFREERDGRWLHAPQFSVGAQVRF